jgi:hypothetical protein
MMHRIKIILKAYRKWLIFIAILIAFAVLSGMGITVLKHKAEAFLRSELPAVVNLQSKGLYALEVGQVHIDLWKTQLLINDIRLIPNSGNVNKAADSSWIIEAYMPSLTFRLGDVYALFTRRFLTFKRIEIGPLEIEILKQGTSANNMSADKIRQMIERVVLQHVSGLMIHNININIKSISTPFQRIDPLILGIHDIYVGAEDHRPLARDVTLNSGAQSFEFPERQLSFNIDTAHYSWALGHLHLQGLSLFKSGAGNFEATLPLLKIHHFEPQSFLDHRRVVIDKLVMQNPRVILRGGTPDTLKVKNAEDWLRTLPFESLDIQHIYLNQAHIETQNRIKGEIHEFSTGGLTLRISGFSADTGSLDSMNLTSLFRQIRIMLTDARYAVPSRKMEVLARLAEYSSITRKLDINGLSYEADKIQLAQRMEKSGQLLYLGSLHARHIGLSDVSARDLLSGHLQEIAKADIQDPYAVLFIDSMRMGRPSQKRSDVPLLPELTCDFLNVGNAGIDLYDASKPQRRYAQMRNTDLILSNLRMENLLAGPLNFIQSLPRYSIKIGLLQMDALYRIKSLEANNLNFSSQSGHFSCSRFGLKWRDPSQKMNFSTDLFRAEGFQLIKLLKDKKLIAVKMLLQKPEIELRRLTEARLPENKASAFSPEIDIRNLEIQNGQMTFYRRDTLLAEVDNLNAVLSGLATDTDTLTGLPKIGLKTGLLSLDRLNAYLKAQGHRLSMGGLRANSQDSTLILDYFRVTPVFGIPRSIAGVLLDLRTGRSRLHPFVLGAQNLSEGIKIGTWHTCKPDIKIAITADSTAPKSARPLDVSLMAALSKATGIQQLQIDSMDFDLGSLVVDYAVHGAKDKHWRFFAPRFDLAIDRADLQKNLYSLIERSRMACYYVKVINREMEHEFSAKYMQYAGLEDALKFAVAQVDFQMYEKDSFRKKYHIKGLIKGAEIFGAMQNVSEAQARKRFDKIHLIQPDVHLTQFHKQTDFISRELEVNAQKNLDSVALAGLLIDDLRMDKGSLTWTFSDSAVEPLKLKDVSVYSRAFETSGKSVPQYEFLTLNAGEFSRKIADDYYTLFVQSLSFDSRQQALILNGMRLEPTYSIFEFAKKAGWEKTRLEMQLGTLALAGFDERKLLENQSLEARNATFDSLWIRSFKDKRYPPASRTLPLPAVQLMGLPFTLTLDTVMLRRGQVIHHQISKNGIKAGRMTFGNLFAFGTNITNDSARIAAQKFAQLEAQFLLQGSGQIAASLQFNLADPNGSFTGEGYMGNMDLTAFNEYLEPVAFTSVRSGMANSMRMKMVADNEMAFGEMVFTYEQLKLHFLNKERPDGRGLGVALKTFMANSVVNTKNPHYFITKKGDIYFERDTSKGIFHYLGRSALSGVVSSIGVDKNKKIIRQIKREKMREAKARREEEEELINSEPEK